MAWSGTESYTVFHRLILKDKIWHFKEGKNEKPLQGGYLELMVFCETRRLASRTRSSKVGSPKPPSL